MMIKNREIKFLVGILMIIIIILLSLEIFTRSILNTSIPWSYEVARTAMIWMVYLGTIVLTWEKNNIKVSTRISKNKIISKISNNIERLLHISISIISISFLSIIIPFNQTSPTTELPIWINYLIIPISLIITSIKWGK